MAIGAQGICSLNKTQEVAGYTMMLALKKLFFFFFGDLLEKRDRATGKRPRSSENDDSQSGSLFKVHLKLAFPIEVSSFRLEKFYYAAWGSLPHSSSHSWVATMKVLIAKRLWI